MNALIRSLKETERLPRWFVSLVALVALAMLAWIFNGFVVPWATGLSADVRAIDTRTQRIEEKVNGHGARLDRIEGRVDDLSHPAK